MLEVVGDLLAPHHSNIDGWLSIQINPNEDDSSVLVREIENFILDAIVNFILDFILNYFLNRLAIQ